MLRAAPPALKPSDGGGAPRPRDERLPAETEDTLLLPGWMAESIDSAIEPSSQPTMQSLTRLQIHPSRIQLSILVGRLPIQLASHRQIQSFGYQPYNQPVICATAFIRCPIPSQDAGNALVTPLGLRVSMGGGDYLARILVCS
ncbi:hypothetical protein EVAR_44805_1 [Eumeta japonica]|uniref:Uncharacterized protein n=1 Tax=Eumeta variegata TaxID=151549 RepID=A0A4C1XB58_EUMVA|nr:hypothetical protein EVAR_44805_1 [Eumeta japonica]